MMRFLNLSSSPMFNKNNKNAWNNMASEINSYVAHLKKKHISMFFEICKF